MLRQPGQANRNASNFALKIPNTATTMFTTGTFYLLISFFWGGGLILYSDSLRAEIFGDLTPVQ